MSVETIRAELQRQKALLGLTYAGAQHDAWITDALAQRLHDLGLSNIADLALGMVRAEIQFGEERAGTAGDASDFLPYVVEARDIPVWVDRRSGALLDTVANMFSPTQDMSMYVGERAFNPNPASDGRFVFLTGDPSGRWNCWISVRMTSVGVPIFYVSEIYYLTGLGESLRSFFALAVAVIGAAGFAGGALLGQAVMGPSFASAYPAATAAIGNTALAAAVNGGDIEAAVKGVAAGFVGGQFGGFVGGALDSATIGSATASATAAALRGDDISRSLLFALLPVGADWVDSQISEVDTVNDHLFPDDYSPSEQYFDPVYDAPEEISVAADYSDPVYDAPPSYEFLDDGSIMLDDGTVISPEGSALYPDGTILSPDGDAVSVESSAPIPAQRSFNAANIAALLTTAAQVYTVWQRAGSPPPKPMPRGTVPSPRTLKPGQPYVGSDGVVTMNNGDGTYSTIRPDGTTQTQPFPRSGVGTALGGMDGKTLALVGGAVLVGALALRK